MAYFTEREGGAKPRVSEDITGAVATAVAALIETRIRDASFGYSYPEMCWEYTSAVVGTDAEALARAVRGYFPDLAWPLEPEQLTGNFIGLDLVEFTFEKIAEPYPRGDNPSHAAYASHQHLRFDVADGRAKLLDEVNRLFERNGLAFHLQDNGRIARLAPEALREVLAPALFHTGDPQLDELLETARRKYLNHDPAVRREGLEKLWDAFERLKTIENPANKKDSADRLLSNATSTAELKTLLETEFKALTDIGNTFMIRHAEVGKTPIPTDDDVDYLFHRMFAAIRRVLRATRRGG